MSHRTASLICLIFLFSQSVAFAQFTPPGVPDPTKPPNLPDPTKPPIINLPGGDAVPLPPILSGEAKDAFLDSELIKALKNAAASLKEEPKVTRTRDVWVVRLNSDQTQALGGMFKAVAKDEHIEIRVRKMLFAIGECIAYVDLVGGRKGSEVVGVGGVVYGVFVPGVGAALYRKLEKDTEVLDTEARAKYAIDTILDAYDEHYNANYSGHSGAPKGGDALWDQLRRHGGPRGIAIGTPEMLIPSKLCEWYIDYRTNPGKITDSLKRIYCP